MPPPKEPPANICCKRAGLKKGLGAPGALGVPVPIPPALNRFGSGGVDPGPVLPEVCDEGEVEGDVADGVFVFVTGAPGVGNDELPQGENAPGPRPACCNIDDIWNI